jgi:NADPH:quinone reductase-like Zn-dependent oxidoreductase
MKAVVLETPGGPESLQYKDWADPQPGAGEVVVRLKAAALNHRDLALRASPQTPVPVILGSDGAGTVEEVGEGVKGWKTGDEVLINSAIGWNEGEEAPPPGFRLLGSPDNGTYAELVKVPAENLFRRPSGFSWEEAAAFPLAALTAYRAVFSRGNVKSNDTVVIIGAGGGVATFLTQMAKAAGARVITTSSSDEKLSKAREIGADEVINYKNTDWVAEVRRLTEKRGADIIIDNVGRATWEASIKAVRSGGKIVVFGSTSGNEAQVPVGLFYMKQINLFGTTMGNRNEFTRVLNYYDQKSLKPVIDRVFPLAETAEAHRYLESAQQFGKVVLSIS